MVDDFPDVCIFHALHGLAALVMIYKNNLLPFGSQEVSAGNHPQILTVSVQDGEIPVPLARHDIPDIIRQHCDRIAFAHIRNVKHYANGDFSEVSHRDCDGDVGILEIMRAYHDCGYEGYIRPDHGRHIWGEECRPGYGLYDRALGIMYMLGCWDMLDRLEGRD